MCRAITVVLTWCVAATANASMFADNSHFTYRVNPEGQLLDYDGEPHRVLLVVFDFLTGEVTFTGNGVDPASFDMIPAGPTGDLFRYDVQLSGSDNFTGVPVDCGSACKYANLSRRASMIQAYEAAFGPNSLFDVYIMNSDQSPTIYLPHYEHYTSHRGLETITPEAKNKIGVIVALRGIDGNRTLVDEAVFDLNVIVRYFGKHGYLQDWRRELVRVTVPVLHSPTTEEDRVSTEEDRPVTFNVLANDSDEDGDPLTLVGVTQPDHGSVTFDPSGSGQVTYTPDPGYFHWSSFGGDRFHYTVSDGRLTSTGTAIVNVAEVDDAPPNTSPTIESAAFDQPVIDAQFSCPAFGPVIDEFSLSPGSYLVTARITGAHMEIKTTALVAAAGNLASQVVPLATADYNRGSLSIEPIGGEGGQWQFNQARDLGFRIVCEGDGSSARTVFVKAHRLGN